MKNSTPSIVSAAYWMLATLLSFSVLAIAVKELSYELNTPEILFFRSVISLIIIIFIISHTGFNQLKTTNLKKHFLRNIAHFLGQYGWVYGIAFIPLAEVFALEFTVPLWTAIIAAILLNESLTKVRVLSIALGLAGVLLILRPTTEIIHPAALAVLGGAICYGLSHTLTRSLAATNSPLNIVFYMTIIQLPLGFFLTIPNWVIPAGIMWLWLLLVAATGLIAHYCMTKAMSLADAMIVVPMDFLRLPLIMLIGFFVYNESIEWFLLGGALLMLIGNSLNLKYEHDTNRSSRNNTEQL